MNPKVLYIEDNEFNALLIRRILQPESYELLEARTGIQGLAIAEQQDVDLILLDINLPDIDGYEVVRRLRGGSKAALTQIPVIAVTANAMKGDAQKALDAGCDLYLSKPIDIRDFLRKVRVCVMGARKDEEDLS